MRILFLGASCEHLFPLVQGHEYTFIQDKITLEEVLTIAPDLIVSFGYRHIVRKPILDAFHNKIINLHISMLPWNKGADPNFWSWYDQTPKGVTIHFMDEGLDTGEILFQKEVNFDGSETLASSYELLQKEMIKLFEENLQNILNLKFAPIAQVPGAGSVHKSVDKEKIFSDLALGWNTACSEIEDLGKSQIS